jgi:exonuclease VII large subunit
MARKEKEIKEFKRRVRLKGTITDKKLTKNGNIKLTIKKEDNTLNFIIIKSHKERFALAQKLEEGNSVSIQGIPKFRAIICTQLKKIARIDASRQVKLENY